MTDNRFDPAADEIASRFIAQPEAADDADGTSGQEDNAGRVTDIASDIAGQKNPNEQKNERATVSLADIDTLYAGDSEVVPTGKTEESPNAAAEKAENLRMRSATIDSQVKVIVEKLNAGEDLADALDTIPKNLQWTRDEVIKRLNPEAAEIKQSGLTVEQVKEIAREAVLADRREQERARLASELKTLAMSVPAKQLPAFLATAKALPASMRGLPPQEFFDYACYKAGITLNAQVKAPTAKVPPRGMANGEAGKGAEAMSDDEFLEYGDRLAKAT